MSLTSRNKGKLGEREAAAELRRLFNVNARRGVQFCGGADSPDVIGLPGVHVEVKRCEQQRLYAWLAQAVGDAGKKADYSIGPGSDGGPVPLILHRQNGKDWLAVCRLDDLPRLATQLYLTLMAGK